MTVFSDRAANWHGGTELALRAVGIDDLLRYTRLGDAERLDECFAAHEPMSMRKTPGLICRSALRTPLSRQPPVGRADAAGVPPRAA